MISESLQVKLSDVPLDPASAHLWVESAGSGGTCIFVGTVRNRTADREVVRLEFEAYEPMAISEMRKIGEYAFGEWPVERIAILHRTGVLAIGEIPVIIAVAAAHRAAAFDACRYCIDTLKETVPIWKKEVFEGGETWVSAHP